MLPNEIIHDHDAHHVSRSVGTREENWLRDQMNQDKSYHPCGKNADHAGGVDVDDNKEERHGEGSISWYWTFVVVIIAWEQQEWLNRHDNNPLPSMKKRGHPTTTATTRILEAL